MKSNFHIILKTYKGKKQLEISRWKNPENYETIRNETSVFEQKPIKVDDLNKIEETRKKNELKNENKHGERQPKKKKLF